MKEQKGGMAMDDTDIIKLFQDRSQDAVSAASEKYGGYCFTVADNILNCKEDSEECVNDTFMKVWNVIPPEIPKALKAFVGKITRNLALDRVKMLHRKKRGSGRYEAVLSELDEMLCSRDNIEKELEDKEVASALNKYLLSLDSESRTVFICRYFYFDSIKSIADKIGRDENRVNYLIRKTKDGLGRQLEKEGLL